MTVAQTRPREDPADVVVLAIHGITGNGMIWRSVARDVSRDTRMSVLAPDLRGRGQNAALPRPYGIAGHVADMLAVMDQLEIERAVLVGHSMGAYVAARIAAEHPDRAAGLVLVDGGTHISQLSREAAAGAHAMLVGPALVRHAMPFPSVQAYLTFWRQHPAFSDAWNDDVEAYVLHDLSGRPGAFRYVISVEAIETDSDDMLSDRIDRNWIDQVQIPLHLLRAQHGVLGDENPLIEDRELDEFVSHHPTAHVEEVHGVNHYTLVLGDSRGPARVTEVIEAAVPPPANA
ncbi:MAG TPA: alpha/beta hydrolase [Solirubrobacteraceae bacterium]|jgi:pimeloyl-ACP methyl ester carboxylesterase|nr:alpha/beta hydrolase [Solirubrobacteraceae bacterium]